MKNKLTKPRHNRVSVHAGQVEFVKVNIGGWHWRDVYQWLLALRWPQFAVVIAAFYITLNLLFATFYAVDRHSIAGTTGRAYATSLKRNLARRCDVHPAVPKTTTTKIVPSAARAPLRRAHSK